MHPRSMLAATCAAFALLHSQAPQPFALSSEESKYFIRGHLAGEFDRRKDAATVTVRSGSVVVVTGDSAVRMRMLIARAGARGWEIASASAALPLGAFAEDERKEITSPLRFDFRLPAGFDPAAHWLVAEFQFSYAATTYMCATTNLGGSPSLAAARSARMKANYVQAC